MFEVTRDGLGKTSESTISVDKWTENLTNQGQFSDENRRGLPLDILSALKGTEIPYRAVRLAFSGLSDGLLDGFLLLT